MMISDGQLRAYLDRELAADDAKDLERSLADDPQLQARMDRLAERAEHTTGLLGELSADAAAPPDARQALARWRERSERPRRVWARPAWGALAASIGIVALLLTWPPARAAAQRFLGLLRFESVAVLKLDRGLLPHRLSDTQAQMFAQVLADSVEQLKKPADNWDPATLEEAEQLAGFPIRLLGDRLDDPKLEVVDSESLAFNVERVRVEQMIDIIGGTDVEIPSRLDGARVRVDIFKAVEASYGDCWPPSDPDNVEWPNCFELRQGPTPAVVSDPELDLGEIAELGLQVAGMSPEEAGAVRRTLDWTSTLVIPMPEDEARHEEIEVDGVRGVLMTDFRRSRRAERPNEYAIVWMKYGMTYIFTGFGDPGLGVFQADNLTE